MAKSADAFRTISEVADWLDTPAHVLRFWESKFSQIKPVKRAGGRRYYRPTDMLLIGGIKKLLHTDGMTIKGVQKMLREHGVKHVANHSQALDDITAAEASDVAVDIQPVQERAPLAQVVELQPDKEELAEGDPAKAPATEAPSEDTEAEPRDAEEVSDAASQSGPEDTEIKAEPVLAPEARPTAEENPPEENPPKDASAETTPVLPSFMHRREEAPKPEEAQEAPAEKPVSAAPTPAPAPTPKPANVDVPADPADDITAGPGVLGQLATLERPVSEELADRLEPILERLRQARQN